MKIYCTLVALIHLMYVLIALNINKEQVKISGETLSQLQNRYMWSFLILLPIYIQCFDFNIALFGAK
mgnify:CR=1 FL=1